MSRPISASRVLAALIAAAALVWLVDTVNTHANETQLGLRNALDQSTWVTPHRSRTAGGGGLDLVDMYQCMCGPDEGVRRWVGWWFIAALFGGVPVAILLRSHRQYGDPQPQAVQLR